VDDRFKKVSMFLLQGLGVTSKQNAWAGPDHWKYQRSKGKWVENYTIRLYPMMCVPIKLTLCGIYSVGSGEVLATESGPTMAKKRAKKKILAEVDIDFTKSLDEELHDIFIPPKNPKSLLLPANRAPASNRLPEDCHYQPEDLVKLFLRPNLLVT
jgi:condensin complex subunit 2